MKSSAYTLLYAAVLGLVCSAMLTGAAMFTKPYRENNKKAERIRNILSVLDIEYDKEASAEALVAIFERNVREEHLGDVETYVSRSEAGEVIAVAVPFDGPGLWGPIKGIMSLDPNLETIRGITFYEQEETPGLGGEIAVPCTCTAGSDPKNCPAWFRHQFTGRRIRDAAGTAGIRIRRDEAAGLNEVDAITGATMTSDKVEAMINTMLQRIAGEVDDGR